MAKLGHEVTLAPPASVKLSSKRQKSGMPDAEFSCEVAQRPTRHYVTVTGENSRAAAIIFRSRDLLSLDGHSSPTRAQATLKSSSSWCRKG